MTCILLKRGIWIILIDALMLSYISNSACAFLRFILIYYLNFSTIGLSYGTIVNQSIGYMLSLSYPLP
jgi:hypothetical protein